ncbi:MAG: prepilin-type N-terminal cleavage/methylation domain-containing protein [Pyrinomonadaceae bacterium]|nr:prepilin-type N-terminal cleavage/methylation domain-containing protein [Pyrinomonadaceae bacterium]
MYPSSRPHNQAGFSVIEMMIATAVMLIISAAVVSLLTSSMSVATATYELTDATESLRTAHEFISRDIMTAGDGLKSLTFIPVSQTFVQNYLTRNPIVDPSMPAGVTNLGILTTDNDIPANTVVKGPDPAVATVPVVTVRSSPVLTDRHTILEIDADFIPISLPAGKITAAGDAITIADVDLPKFTAGEVYFLTSSVGGTFGTLTSTTDTAGANATLTFATGATDKFGLNVSGANNRFKVISNSGALVTSLLRMRIIHYYIDSDGRLMRRVFGVKGAGFRESAIAEHIVSLQFLYSLGPDSTGVVAQPVNRLIDLGQQISVRKVEVTISAETPHKLAKGLQPQLQSTMATSVRNMQFRYALQPTANP